MNSSSKSLSKLHRCGVFLDLATVGNDLDLGPLHLALPDWTFHPNTSDNEVVERVADAEIVVLNKVALREAHFAVLPRLKLVTTAATGVDQIDLVAARKHGVVVSNARNYATESVAQHAITMMLTLLTNIDRYAIDARSGRWSDAEHFCLLDHPIRELSELTVGIIGYGDLGRRVATLAQAFGARVLVADSLRGNQPVNTPIAPVSRFRTPISGSGRGYHASYSRKSRALSGRADTAHGARLESSSEPPRLPLDCLLSSADIVSLHCPLTPDTRHLFNAARIRRMKRGSILINTARGGLIDAQALARALRSEHLSGAGIDVLESEPPSASHPLLADDIPNLLLTPHTAWASKRARQNAIAEVAANIQAYLEGHPRNAVNAGTTQN